eukprot:COSAG06_NODE_2428_length_6891_cov_11.077433_4_plen_49_part_00
MSLKLAKKAHETGAKDSARLTTSCYSRMTVLRGVAQRWRKGGVAAVCA